jgi:hypothetical protein
MPGPNPVNSPNPGEGAFTVVPSDVTALAVKPRAIYVGGTGDVTLVTLNGETVTFKAVPVGTILPVRASFINSTSTTATLMVGIY